MKSNVVPAGMLLEFQSAEPLVQHGSMPSAVDVCVVPTALFVHKTSPPSLMVTELGLNAKFTIDTFVVAANALPCAPTTSANATPSGTPNRARRSIPRTSSNATGWNLQRPYGRVTPLDWASYMSGYPWAMAHRVTLIPGDGIGP